MGREGTKDTRGKSMNVGWARVDENESRPEERDKGRALAHPDGNL